MVIKNQFSRLFKNIKLHKQLIYHKAVLQSKTIFHTHRRLFSQKPEQQKIAKSNLKKVISLVRPHFRIIILASSGLIVSTAISMCIPASFGYVIDNVSQTKDLNFFSFFSCLGAMFVVGAMASFVRIYYFNLASERLIFQLRRKLFHSLLHKNIRFFDRSQVGELVTRLNSDLNEVGKSFAGENISFGLRNVSQLIGAFGFMLYLSIKLSAVTAAVLPVSYVSSKLYGKYVKKISQEYQQQLSNSASVAEESISNIRTVKNFNKERFELIKYIESIKKIYEVAVDYSKMSASFFSFTMLTGNGTLLMILTYGSYLASIGEITVGTLTSFLFYALYVGYSGVNIASFFSQVMKGFGASTKVFDLISHKNMESDSLDHVLVPIQPISVKFENVNFCYSQQLPGESILTDFSFEFLRGKKYAIIGPSGQGKSTIISLLMKFYEPISGRILLGNVEISKLSHGALRKFFGVVSQDIELFSGTILDNIIYGLDETQLVMDKKELLNRVIDAAKKANAHEFITKFPLKYLSQVGNKSATLSGGEKQRIAFARAILTDPDIFLFDEVTSALDPRNEELILKAIEGINDKLVIMVTHSLRLLEKSDYVLLLKNGKVEKCGSPSEFDFQSHLDLKNLYNK